MAEEASRLYEGLCEALAAFNKALELNPNYQRAWFNKGNVLASLGKPEDALAAFDKATEI
jgi:tetratricopeptide (TPR) repeat protein